MYSQIEEYLQFICSCHLHEAHEIDPDVEDEFIDIHLPISFLGSRE